MKELTLGQHLVTTKDDTVRKTRTLWSILLMFASVGSGACMLAGLSISLLSWLGAIPVSAIFAYLTVGFLLSSLSLSILAAHCMDRAAAAERAERKETEVSSSN